MSFNGIIEHYPGIDYPVANLTMTVGSEVACALFNSCKKNPFVATLASGTSAPGFLQFMGTNAVTTGLTDIHFAYSEDPEKSLQSHMYPCDFYKTGDEIPSELKGYDIEECVCNDCEEACKMHVNVKMPNYFDGFDITLVIIVYATVVLLSVLILYLK